MPSVAFIGLGTMGASMARNLLRKGHDVIGVDINQQAVDSFAAEGGRISASAREAVSNAEFVVTMLPDDRTLEELFLSADSILAAAGKSTLFIDCSTVSVTATRKVAEAVEAMGAASVDAPVSGGPAGARNASLIFMVGAQDADLERARPVLESMGTSIIHMGGHGAGQAAKQCNNMLAAIIMAGTAEAIGLGVRNGLDPARLSSVMQNSTAGSNLLTRWNPWPGINPDAPSSKGYEGGFQVDLMLKDLGLAMDSAQAAKYSTPLGALTRNLYAMCTNLSDGAGGKDFSYIRSVYASDSSFEN